MPSDQKHIDQAKHNIQFLENFYSDYKFNDWSITVSFYTCIHIIEAAIYKEKKITYLKKEQIADHLFSIVKDGDLVLTLGAGDINKVSDELIKKLERQYVKSA